MHYFKQALRNTLIGINFPLTVFLDFLVFHYTVYWFKLHYAVPENIYTQSIRILLIETICSFQFGKHLKQVWTTL